MLCLVLLLLLSVHAAAVTITSFSASDSPWTPPDGRTLVSTGSKNSLFVAGFRPSPSDASRRIFAVWANATGTDEDVVWFAHDASGAPVDVDASNGFLAVSPGGAGGVLSLNDSSSRGSVWSQSAVDANATELWLNTSGSLVFGAWSSFSQPTDTILAGQAIPANGTTLRRGQYELANASMLLYNSSYSFNSMMPLVSLTDDGYLTAAGGGPSLITADSGERRLRRLTLDADGNLRVHSFLSKSRRWSVVWQAVQELCTIRGTCGENAICVPDGGDDAISCVCPPGFRKSSDGGCTIKTRFRRENSKFLSMDFVAFGGGNTTSTTDPGPDKSVLPPTNFDQCQANCSVNADCVAFGYQFDGSRTCYLYVGRLADGYWSPSTGGSTYIRVDDSETDVSSFAGMMEEIETVCPVKLALPVPLREKQMTVIHVTVIVTLFTVELLAGVFAFRVFLRKYSHYRDMAQKLGFEYSPAGGPRRFTYAELKAATKDFSDDIGRGGYGTVYRGELPDRRAIAVKKLRGFGGVEAEFWAEVTIIARMHHLNLVRMWGFCTDKEQRMLVYEFVSNGSLDKHLFPRRSPPPPPPSPSSEETAQPVPVPAPAPVLDLNTRYRIALGVARAVAYLHEECLEWVLHCDIKPENILLEDDFCPKVSDFGLSKLATKKEKVTMSRIRGTRGYMAPEWVMQREPITSKADVYSFGMVVLEIVSGRRNYDFRQESVRSEDWYFPKWTFEKVYMERKIEDIVDPRLLPAAREEPEKAAVVERMVKTALWCVQDRPDKRPSMGKVAKMLEGAIDITDPERPSIFCDPAE